jgi:hypothetical protein
MASLINLLNRNWTGDGRKIWKYNRLKNKQIIGIKEWNWRRPTIESKDKDEYYS